MDSEEGPETVLVDKEAVDEFIDSEEDYDLLDDEENEDEDDGIVRWPKGWIKEWWKATRWEWLWKIIVPYLPIRLCTKRWAAF